MEATVWLPVVGHRAVAGCGSRSDGSGGPVPGGQAEVLRVVVEEPLMHPGPVPLRVGGVWLGGGGVANPPPEFYETEVSREK